jgi:hypothetical protein
MYLFLDPCLIRFKPSGRSSVKKMLALLEEYIAALRETEVGLDDPQTQESQNYLMPTDIVSPNEWAEFDNVYQIHCPSVFMDSAVRDVRSLSLSLPRSVYSKLMQIMIQYYYCSRERRGFEYHMAHRCVSIYKFNHHFNGPKVL